MEEIVNAVFQRVLAAMREGRAETRMGIVTGYDPNTYSAMVKIMPEEIEVGWLPIEVQWVGSSFGSYYGPLPGDQVRVTHVEGDVGSGVITGRVNDETHRPPAVPGGEAWHVHKSGSVIKMLNNGDIEVVSARDLIQTVGRNLVTTVGGDVTTNVSGKLTETVTGKTTMQAQEFDLTGDINETGNVNVTGNIGASGTVSDATRSISADRAIYDIHTHNQSGGGVTSVPNQQE